ncbi:DNA-binding transcriptional activator of the SARP family [Nonomuraea solani]|uniref:DNA-binding transcriptional activator of the SARP family n=1 Tax=Nonomuraea solani TaxID=1144553 RepID=A0A1H6DUJ4_9ACTN|nr:AfsR/SARP family transcriptional regulator [Nonomuraea solani]SEG88909.1 DNA-binding transcriptional activator of the SARP family [Nonomuraea solani]
MGLEIKLLGPWETTANGVPVRLTGERRIGVLARLALSAGQPVAAEELLTQVWGEHTATTAGKQLHIVVSKLRGSLGPYRDVIETVSGGYQLNLACEHVDAHRFTLLGRRARAARARGDITMAGELFQRALALWRGDALAGMTASWARVESARLEEERLTTLEDHADLRLAAGDHDAVVPVLTAHAEAHPLRERPRAQLMLALYRAARASEALAVYEDTRRVMADELGIEPGVALRGLRRAVLRRDPALHLAAPAQRTTLAKPVIPIELPADTRAFTARTTETAWLHRTLTDTVSGLPDAATVDGTVPGPPAVAAVHGPGGMGKSALAVHAAHAVAGRFADGVLYVDLRGATAGVQPLSPYEALSRLLRSLGLGGAAIPATLEEATARYRSLTSTRNLLVLLDDALDATQVRPLIPAGPSCAVIVTSRQIMASLDGASHLRLTGLEPDDATELFARIADPGRLRAEPDAARRIIRQCGGLPLALRIAAARLAAHSGRTLTALADQLADPDRRLDALEHADLAIRDSIAVSLEHLPAEPVGHDAAHTFLMLGLLETPTHTVPAASALTDWPEHRAETALNHLLDARLLEPAGPGRYRMHDLIRLYAREQAVLHVPEPVRITATLRAFHHFAAQDAPVYRRYVPASGGPLVIDAYHR